MKFKYFYEQLLNESAEDGDVMEGIFAISLALYIANGKVSASDVDKVRKELSDKNTSYTIDTNIADNPNIQRMVGSIDSKDNIKVIVSLKLKKSALKSFGPNHQTSKSVSSKIQTLIDKAVETKSISRINTFIKEILTNKKPDDIVFYVIADGVDAGNKSGDVKSDVKIKIQAKTNTSVPEDINVPLNFSLKISDDSSMPKFANSGIFDMMFQLAKSFRLPMVKGMESVDKIPKLNTGWPDQLEPLEISDIKTLSQKEGHFISFIKKYFDIQSSIKSKDLSNMDPDEANNVYQDSIMAELDAARFMYNTFLHEFGQEVERMEDSAKFNSIVFGFLEKHIFGSDLADVITISNKDIKEIHHTDFQKLIQKVDCDFQKNGQIMKFYDRNTGKLLFQIRPRIESPSGRRGSIKKELAIEVGDLIYT